VPAAAQGPQLVDIAQNPFLRTVLVEHAQRGIRIQLFLRWLLAAFMLLVAGLVPPAQDRVETYVIAAAYAVWAVGFWFWARQATVGLIRVMWLALLIDLTAVTVVVLVASESDVQSWTADVLVNGFFVLPVLAATQLRVRICAAVAIPTVAVYLASSALARHANGDEPWSAILLSTLALAVVAAGCILLTRLQLSRVLTIGQLVRDRDQLISELLGIEERERRTLAEDLHDGALQFVLAARQDLDDARRDGDAASFDRVDHALRESSQLLRSTVGQLHPAVLEQAGLLAAVRDLAQGYANRGHFAVTVDGEGWDERTRTGSDALLYSTARELLGNIVKHADANEVTIRLEHRDGRVVLQISDDGRGIRPDALAESVRGGHIGLESRRVRLEGAGGALHVSTGPGAGTTIRAEVPALIADRLSEVGDGIDSAG
jgi:two-component system NarL family sensor kinase